MWPLSFELTLSLARAVAMILALLTAAWGFRHWRHRAECDAQRMFEQLDLIRAELMLLSERIEGLETPAPNTHERPAPPPEVRVPAAPSAPAPRGYEVAARLARGGATCDELISSCGLSRHEAELLMRLHQAEAMRSNGQLKIDKGQLKASEEKRTRLSVVG